MNRFAYRRRYLPYWLAIMVIAALLPTAPDHRVALAQNVPAPCLNDAGQPVRPAAVVGAWALALNFNHPPSATVTLGCRITTVSINPQQLTYDPINCSLVNNGNGVQVGGGAAPFDGIFWLTCPNGPAVPGYGPMYNSFAIYGRAQFPSLTTGANFTIMEHPDVSLNARVNPSANIKLTSKYGPYSYETTDTATNVTAAPFFFGAFVYAGNGQHRVASNTSPFATQVDQFPFSPAPPISFGRAQQPWTLLEIVVDPPPPRGGLSG